jgi:hypothetical protein
MMPSEMSSAVEALRAAAMPALPPSTPPDPGPGHQRDDGQLRPSASQAARLREAWVKQGLDPAVIDAAAQADGVEITVPIPPELAQVDRQHGVTEDVDPSAYAPVFPRSLTEALPIERLAGIHDETTALCAVIGLPPHLGNAVIEHIADVGPRVGKLSDDAKAEWVRGQRELAVRYFGDEKSADAALQKARSVILSAHGSPFGAALADSKVLQSSFLIRTLVNFADTKSAWEAARGVAQKQILDRNVVIAQQELDRQNALLASVADARAKLERAKAAAAR